MVKVILLEYSLLLNPILILRDQQKRQQQLIPLQLVIILQFVASVRRVEMIGIDVAGLPVSSNEILWVECSKCEQ